MPLIVCPDCGREVSSSAPACMGCGAPVAAMVEHATRSHALPRYWPLMLVGAIGAVLVLALWPGKRDPAEGVDYPTTATREAASARKARPDVPDAVKVETLQNFAGLPGVKHVEWVRGDFIMAVNDAGGSWRPVADSACVWIRQRGAPAGFSVYVLEASALRNKRWEQLARSRCN